MSGIAGKLLCICSHSISLLSEIHSHKMDKALIVPSMLLPPVLPENLVLYKSRERTPILIFFVMMSLIG